MRYFLSAVGGAMEVILIILLARLNSEIIPIWGIALAYWLGGETVNRMLGDK